MAQATCLCVIFLLAAPIAQAAGPFRRGGPTTTDNDASCDISVAPAATLLLPYFEVDVATPTKVGGEMTIFTITNTGQLPQIARVTLWTNLAYPIFTFNIYLTGYDVQSINLSDVILRGRIGSGTGPGVSPVGELSSTEWKGPEHDNPVIDEQSCVNLPVQLSAAFIERMKTVFTTGVLTGAGGTECRTAGRLTTNERGYTNAVGYATIDVVGRCDSTLPNDVSYFEHDIRYDNVLIGDYQQVDGEEDLAQANTMVHIRAIPEGGSPGTRVHDPELAVNVPRTFYSVYQSAARPRLDARQPLPSLFAARWVDGTRAGFETHYKIWREVRVKPGTCSRYERRDHIAGELVRFDEDENPETPAPSGCAFPPCYFLGTVLTPTSLTNVARAEDFPPQQQCAAGGWMYLNLADVANDRFARQGWVVTSMRSEDRYSVDIDAAWLGNGCSAPVPSSEATFGTAPIGPAPNVRP